MGSPKKPVVVVVGSLHYDIMVDAPDRPRKGETVTGSRWYPKFGGKGGNQAVAAARAGAEVRMAGAVGDDEFGRFLLSHLAAAGVDSSRVARLQQGSGMSVAITDADGDYGAVIVSGANGAIDPIALDDAALWRGARLLVLQNELPDRINLAAATAARQARVVVCMNAAPYRTLPGKLAQQLDVLAVNAIEAEQLCGLAVTDLDSAARAADALADRFPMVIVTAGGAGVVGKQRGHEPVKIAALPVQLVSTHGAGDVFVGTFAAALASQVDFPACLRAANAAAADHVAKPVNA